MQHSLLYCIPFFLTPTMLYTAQPEFKVPLTPQEFVALYALQELNNEPLINKSVWDIPPRKRGQEQRIIRIKKKHIITPYSSKKEMKNKTTKRALRKQKKLEEYRKETINDFLKAIVQEPPGNYRRIQYQLFRSFLAHEPGLDYAKLRQTLPAMITLYSQALNEFGQSYLANPQPTIKAIIGLLRK